VRVRLRRRGDGRFGGAALSVRKAAGSSRHRRRAAAVAVSLLLLTAAAQAQWSGSVAAESDYRFRGESLSAGRPAVRLSANHDGAGGWYAGASATQSQLNEGDRYAQVLGYAGCVRPLGGSASLEFGATGSAFVGQRRYDFAELYAGLLISAGSLRLSLSPDYFGRHVRTAYLDANGQWPLFARTRLIAHAGLLVPLSTAATAATAAYAVPVPPGPAGANRSRADLRAGIGWASGNVDLNLTWSAVSPGGPPPVSASQRRRGWVFGATWYF